MGRTNDHSRLVVHTSCQALVAAAVAAWTVATKPACCSWIILLISHVEIVPPPDEERKLKPMMNASKRIKTTIRTNE